MPNPKTGMIWGFGDVAAPRRGAGSGTFWAGEKKEMIEVQRQSTFVDEIRENSTQEVFKPLPPDGLGKCKQKWTNPQMLTPFGRGSCEAKTEEYKEERVAWRSKHRFSLR